MFKNTLFLKIILIFTLPALGILYFSSILVNEKINFLKEVEKTEHNLEYMKVTQRLIHSLQKERGLSISLGKDTFVEELKEQRKLSDNAFANYLAFVNQSDSRFMSDLSLYIKNLQESFNNLENLRKEVGTSNTDILEIIDKYTKIDELLLGSIYSIKSVPSALDFNNEYLNMYHFLVYKEYCGVERALITYVLHKGKIDNRIDKKLSEVRVTKDMNFNYFDKNSSVKMLNIYNNEITGSFIEQIDDIRFNIEEYVKSKTISAQDWWDLSTKRIDKLDIIFESMIVELNNISKDTQKKATSEQGISFFFAILCFVTLISLFFVLRNIVFKEQKFYNTIEKQRKVYELLNEANKYLLKNDTKEELYSQINGIISKNPNMVFSFIYDFEDTSLSNKVFAQDGKMKEILFSRLDEFEDIDNSDNLLTRAKKSKANIPVKSFEIKNASIFYKYAKEFNIKSAIAFPIKKFDEVVSVLVIYSNKDSFFDYEVEILFNKMINDLTHILEKIDYEKNRLEQERELKVSSVAFESSEPMLITDSSCEIIKVNQAFCQVMGYSKDEILGKNPKIFKSVHQDRKFAEELWTGLKLQGFWSGEVYNKKANEQIIPLRATITAIKDNKGKITHFLGQYIDIGVQKDKEKILEYQATHDNLTGLPNRLLLLDRIEHAITKVVRHRIVGGLIFIDLDNFKEVNDTLGHDIGDALLIMVARKIKEVIRDEDTIARIGGDEFIVLLDNVGNNKFDAKTNISNLAEKIKDTLNSITHIEGNVNISTPSIGITLFSDSSVSVKDIIKQADTAMYVAKKQGKNAIEFFD